MDKSFIKRYDDLIDFSVSLLGGVGSNRASITIFGCEDSDKNTLFVRYFISLQSVNLNWLIYF